MVCRRHGNAAVLKALLLTRRRQLLCTAVLNHMLVPILLTLLAACVQRLLAAIIIIIIICELPCTTILAGEEWKCALHSVPLVKHLHLWRKVLLVHYEVLERCDTPAQVVLRAFFLLLCSSVHARQKATGDCQDKHCLCALAIAAPRRLSSRRYSITALLGT